MNGVRCAVCGARYTVCAARCTVYGVARELGLDRECGNADIGGTRMVEDCVQPFKNMKQVLYTKRAYRFWARPYVTNSMRKRARQFTSRTPYAVRGIPIVDSVRCAVHGVRCAVRGACCTV